MTPDAIEPGATIFHRCQLRSHGDLDTSAEEMSEFLTPAR
jgi:hypothetical protein